MLKIAGGTGTLTEAAKYIVTGSPLQKIILAINTGNV